MESVSFKSEKIRLGKWFSFAWGIAAVLLCIILIISFIKYEDYKNGQLTALDLLDQAGLMNYIVWEINSYKDQIELMEHLAYDSFDFYKSRELRNIMDDALKARGFHRYSFGDYCLYTSYLDFSFGYFTTELICTMSIILLLLLGNLFYLIDRRSSLVVENNTVVYTSCTGKTRQFILKEIKSVESAGLKGLMLKGNSIKIKLNLIKNRKEINTAIMDFLVKQSYTEIL